MPRASAKIRQTVIWPSMTSAATAPRLWHFRISHYNEKVRWALDYKRWPHTRKTLIPGFHIATARWLTGQNQVPIAKLDGRIIVGSAHILDEIERLHPDPPLFPVDAAERQRAMEIQAFFDEQVAPDLRRLFWSTYIGHPAACARMAADGGSAATHLIWRAIFPAMKPVLRANMGMSTADLTGAHERLNSYFDYLESKIRPSGYLVGEGFGVADLAAAAVMTAIIRPPEFPYPLPEPWPPELVELRNSVAEREGFRWVLRMYSRHRGTSSEIGA